MKQYFAKSFEEDFILKSLEEKRKIPFQSIQNILETKTIKPNTNSFGKKKRLACIFINKNYLKTYRSQGLIFQTKAKPVEIFPFDLALLTSSNKIIVQYYRIKNSLHEYYNRKLIEGFDSFRFKNIKKMISKIPSPKIAWKLVNSFRKEKGFESLSKQKYKLVEYNEVIFSKKVKIKPVAVFGYSKLSREIAKKCGLPHENSVKKFRSRLK